MKDFAVFWGCTIPARFPFIEMSTRVLFDDLGPSAQELPGFTCCPESVPVTSSADNAHYPTAAPHPSPGVRPAGCFR